MGLLHAGILNALPACEVVSIAEKESILIRFAKKLLPNLSFYPNVGEMLAREQELDAVYVTTPISSHLPILREIVANRRKVALFVEKPLASNYHDAMAIVDLTRRPDLKTMMGFQKRFSPIFQKAKQLLQQGILGELNKFESYSYVSDVQKEGKGWRFVAGQGGAVLDLGPHLIDLLLWYFGEPVEVDGTKGSLHSKEVDDFAHCKLKFERGFEGTLDVSWSIDGYRIPETGLSVIGTNGKLQVTDDYLELELYSNASAMNAGKYRFSKPEFRSGVDFLIGDPEYCLEDKYFVDCILEAKTPEPDFGAGLRVNQIIERIRDSTR